MRYIDITKRLIHKKNKEYRVIEPRSIETPDYIVKNKKFDLKQIYGDSKNTIDTAISKKRNQSENFIFDITITKMSVDKAIKQINSIYNSKHRNWVNIIILIKDDNIIKILKRN